MPHPHPYPALPVLLALVRYALEQRGVPLPPPITCAHCHQPLVPNAAQRQRLARDPAARLYHPATCWGHQAPQRGGAVTAACAGCEQAFVLNRWQRYRRRTALAAGGVWQGYCSDRCRKHHAWVPWQAAGAQSARHRPSPSPPEGASPCP
jgi:hypothetical protein